MDRLLERIYLTQIIEDCGMFGLSITAFNKAKNASCNNESIDELFMHAFSSIHRAAAISRMFWPPGSKDKSKSERSRKRGEHLRSVIEIDHNHPIRSRSIRDNLEHFDERLDDWAENSKYKNMIKKFLGPRSAVSGIEDSDIIHHYDPKLYTYYFRGQPFNLQALTNGVKDIFERASKRLIELERTS